MTAEEVLVVYKQYGIDAGAVTYFDDLKVVAK